MFPHLFMIMQIILIAEIDFLMKIIMETRFRLPAFGRNNKTSQESIICYTTCLLVLLSLREQRKICTISIFVLKTSSYRGSINNKC